MSASTPSSGSTGSSPLLALGSSRYVSLTTFRRSGVGVSTPVWVARDGDSLIVTTPSGSGKVKRLRNDSRVQLRPCSRTGAVADGAPTATGRATVTTTSADVDAANEIVRRKYPIEYRIFMLIESIAKRGDKSRAIIRIVEG